MRAFLVLLIFSLTPSIQALEVYSAPAGHPLAQWTLLYNEDQKWVIERVELDAAGWPVLKSRHHFKDLNRARAKMGPRVHGMVKSDSLPEDSNHLTGLKNDSLWPVTQEWSWEWELKFSQWVTTELDRNWWVRHNLATDCADVAYSARWIFARNNGLPMANRLGNGQWFTNRSVKPEWKRLPTAPEWHNDKRFLAALNYMLDFVFTHSLWNDSYPIAINSTSLIPGTHHLGLTDTSGHTQLIYKVGLQPDQIPVLTLNSTIPREVRELSEWLFFGHVEEGKAGLLRMRWPKWNGATPALTESARMPHYSEEQFDPLFIQAPRSQFWEEVFYRINPNVDFDQVGLRALRQVLDLVVARVPIVEEGYQACAGNQCPEGGAAYELHSTPTRDGRISAAIDVFAMLQPYIRRPELVLPIFESEILTQEGYTFTLGQIISGWRRRFYSSNPNVEPILRWGLHPRAGAEKLVEIYQKGLAARQNKIGSVNRCQGASCTFGSPAYIEESTFITDSDMWHSSDFIADYCATFDTEMCDDLKRRLDAITLTADGRTQGISQWMDQSLLFNSDPRHIRERRWFGFSHEIPHFTFQARGFQSTKIYEGSLIFITGNDFGPLRAPGVLWTISGNGYAEWSAPTGETIENLDAKAGWIWTSQGNNLLARKIDSPQPLKFTLPRNFSLGEVHAGRALVHLPHGDHLVLRIDPDGIVQESQMQFEYAHPGGPGLTLFNSATAAHPWIYDHEAGQLFPLPRYAQMASITRGQGALLVRYVRETDGASCAAVTAQGTTVLNQDGDCLKVLPSGVAAFAVNGELKIRTYTNWRQTGERAAGDYEAMMGNLILTITASGGSGALCAQTTGFVDLPQLSDQRMYNDCNDRYAITYAEGRTWRVMDLASRRAVFEVKGWTVFASPHEREHLVLARASDDGEISLTDLDHPEQFSLMTDFNLWGMPTPYDRKDGLFVLKHGQGIYLKTAL